MTTEQALLHARRYVEAVKGCTTIGSFPIKGETPRRHIVGVSTIDRTFEVGDGRGVGCGVAPRNLRPSSSFRSLRKKGLNV